MASIRIEGFALDPVVPEAPPLPSDDNDTFAVRTDELFARRVDNDLADELYNLLHHPETGIAAKSSEDALATIGEALPGLGGLKDRYLGEAMGPRQSSILEPLIDARLDDAFELAAVVGRSMRKHGGRTHL